MSGDNITKSSLKGTVIKADLGGVSKSAHTGFVLRTDGKQIKLRRQGGSPFYDEFFEKYENKPVHIEGYDMDQYFLVTKIK